MRTILFAVLLAFAGAAFATGPGGLDWNVRGNLGVDHTTTAGSGVGVGSDVFGSLRMDAPGRTTVSAWSLNRTNVRSLTAVRNCGPCGPALVTRSSGNSYSAGGASGTITPRRDPVRAGFSAYGDGVAFTEFTRSLTLNVRGGASFDAFQAF